MKKIAYDITFHPSWWAKNAGVSFNRDFFCDHDYRIASDIKMRKLLYDKFGAYGLGEKNPAPRPILGSDLIACGYLHSQILGCEIIYSDDNAPQVKCKNLSEKEVADLECPDLDTNEVWLSQQKQIDKLLSKYGKVDSCLNLMGVQNIALDLRGQELFCDYYTEPELAKRLLDVCFELSVNIGKRLKAHSKTFSGGVTAIIKQVAPDLYLTSDCSVDLISCDCYEEFLLDYDSRLAKEFSPFGVHHCGKSAQRYSKSYNKIPGLAFLEAGAFSDLKAVRADVPDAVLNARYSPVSLLNNSVSVIEQEVEELYRCGADAISSVGIDKNVPDEKIEAFLNACKECN